MEISPGIACNFDSHATEGEGSCLLPDESRIQQHVPIIRRLLVVILPLAIVVGQVF